jgi:xenotropic and polytropic retrovirus receptor 1
MRHALSNLKLESAGVVWHRTIMKFEKYLNREAIPEWRPKYIDYRLLKGHLKKIPLSSRDALQEDVFVFDLLREQEKALRFLLEKESALEVKLVACMNAHQQIRKFLHFRKSLINLYTETDLLKNFRSLNAMASGKIIKKFTKVTGHADQRVVQMILSTGVIDRVGQEIEDIFTSKFTSGDRHGAMRQLRIRNLGHETFHTSAMIGGFLWGLSAAGVAHLYFVQKNAFYIQMISMFPLLTIGLFSLNIFLFKGAFVNFRFVFQFDKRSVLHECQYLALTGSLVISFVIGAIMTVYLKGPPFVPLLVTLLVSVNPFGPWKSARWWFFECIARILTAPFHPVLFKDFFVADHLVSLTGFFQFIPRVLNVSSSEGLVNFKLAIGIFPVCLRILQCARRFMDTRIKINLLNALKYCLVMVCVIMRSVFDDAGGVKMFIVISCLQFVSTLFSLWWDFAMDFGILSLRLREQLCFLRPVYYYVLIFDCCGRFVWVWGGLFSRAKVKDDGDLVLLALIELIRRFNWSLLRIEFEHLNNCNAFRAVEDFKLPEGVVGTTADLYYNDMLKASDGSLIVNENQSEGDNDSEDLDDDVKIID